MNILRKIPLGVYLVLITATIAFAAAGVGFSTWTSLTTIATGDLLGVTDVSNTTDSDNGTSSAITWGNLMAAPGAIGGTTPAAGAFTSLSATSGLVTTQGEDPDYVDFREGTDDGGTYKHRLSGADYSADYTSPLPGFQIGWLNTSAVSITGEVSVNTLGTFTVPITTNPYSFTAPNLYNSVIWYGATGELDLAAGVDGMATIIYNTGAFTITIDPNGSEVIVRDGTAQTGGVTITLSSGAGNFVSLVFNGTQWVTMGYKGTLAEGS